MTRCSSSTLALDRLKVPSCNGVSTGEIYGEFWCGWCGTCLLLCQLSCTLVLAVSEEFDNAALVRGETCDLLDNLANEGSALAGATLQGTTLRADASASGLANMELNGRHGCCWCVLDDCG
jgi:thiol-disulfide isomerase/thioredoxin